MDEIRIFCLGGPVLGQKEEEEYQYHKDYVLNAIIPALVWFYIPIPRPL